MIYFISSTVRVTGANEPLLKTKEGGGVRFEWPQENLLSELDDKTTTRKDVAKSYALLMKHGHNPDWEIINKAIIDRWSISALNYIKDLAWSGKAFNDQT